MKLDTQQLQLLEALGDQIIPVDAQMMSASQAEISTWSDSVLEARPDLVSPLLALLESARSENPRDFVDQLRRDESTSFDVFSEVVCGAYFMNPLVQKAIGYNGQGPREIDPRVDYLEDGLLESVIKRGPIYRPTPAQ